MAFPTAVNIQITDSVTQSNLKVLGDAPAMALANLYQATAQALSLAAHNATALQQQNYVLAQAATVSGISLLFSEARAVDLDTWHEAVVPEATDSEAAE